MMRACLFVTSFARDMYETTGRRLVESFQAQEIPASLLVCHEQQLGADVVAAPPRLLTYDLDGSAFLRQWLADNRDIIPTSLGGSAERCACPEPDEPFGAHRERCPWAWFNKNASRWFRKIVSLDHALTLDGVDAVIWIDSDCRFLKPLPAAEIDEWFGQSSIFFVKGPRRAVIEAGILGFRLDDDGRAVLRAVIERYRSGAFREDVRWDDGYQFQVVIELHPQVAVTDWGGSVVGSGHVVPLSRIGQYVSHFKGAHNLSGLMT